MNTNNKIKTAVLFGGVSSEHEVSLMSATSILQNIPKEKYDVLLIGITKDGRWLAYNGDIQALTSQDWEKDPTLKPVVLSQDRSRKGVYILEDGKQTFHPIDICFPVLHGKNGEDGTIQGLFQLAGMPFVGCDMISSANCMDKEVTHTILESNGIPMAKWCSCRQSDLNFPAFAEKAEEKLGYPMFVKPANAGSSVGVTKAHNRDELQKALQVAFEQDRKAIVEEFVDGLEVETAVLGNENPKAADVCGELTPVSEFYTYEAKYIDGTTALHIPARIPQEVSERLRATAEKAFTAIGGEGFARVDFFVRKADQQIILNEINTIPGFTSISMYPKLWEASGLAYSDLIDRLLQLGLARSTEPGGALHG